MGTGGGLRISAPEDLDPDAIVRIAGGEIISLDPGLLRAVAANWRAMLGALTGSGSAVYGVSTGVGRFADHRLDAQAQAEQQYHLLAGRAVGARRGCPRGHGDQATGTAGPGDSSERPAVPLPGRAPE